MLSRLKKILIGSIFIVGIVSTIIILKYFEIITKELLTKIISFSAIGIALLLLVIFRKEIASIWSKASSGSKTLDPIPLVPIIKKYFKENWAKSVKIEFRQTYYNPVKEGEDKIADFWIFDTFSKETSLLRVPLSRGIKAVKNGDFQIIKNESKVDNRAKIKQFSPKEATDPNLEALKEFDEKAYKNIITGKYINVKPKFQDEYKPAKDINYTGEDTFE